MPNYREIVTKTIIGKGKKVFIDTGRKRASNTPSTILGCWVINHNFEGSKNNDSITIRGSYDINVWYSFDNDTKTDVLKENIPYIETVHFKNRKDVVNEEVIIRSLRQPNCVKVDIDGDDIVYTVEKELGIELVGDEKVKIAVDEDEEPWDEIVDDKTDKQINEEVKEDYIDDKTINDIV